MHIIKHLSILSLILFLACNNTSDFKTVKIGDQVWMAENLNVDTFRNGDPIFQAETEGEWRRTQNTSSPAWCYYDYDPANEKKYGKLYNWYAVNDPRGLAPEGWKIPSEDDWTLLINYFGGSREAGKKMKYTDFWADYEGESGNGTNESGFSGLPGGGLSRHASYIGKNGYWWSSTDITERKYLAWVYELDYNVNYVTKDYRGKHDCYSVRCIKETDSSEQSASSKEVSIGNQVWMTQNLNVDKFRNGDPIPHAKTDKEWEKAGENGEPAWCYYDNNPANGEKYGKLYNWYAVNDPRGLAPMGWHIPNDKEWAVLTDFFGGKSVTGDKMKNINGWYNDGNDISNGFFYFLGGNRNYNGYFNNIGDYGFWWSSSEDGTYDGWTSSQYYNDGISSMEYVIKGSGISVRCLRD